MASTKVSALTAITSATTDDVLYILNGAVASNKITFDNLQKSITDVGTVVSGTIDTGCVLGGVTMTLGTDADLDIYYRSSGVLTRLPKGTALQALRINAAGTGLEYAAAAGGGDVSKVGTPVNSQVGVWTGDGTIEGASSLTYDGSNLQLTGDIGSTGTRITKGWFADLQVTNSIAGSITGTAAVATTVTVTDNESTAEENVITFVAGAVGSGNVGLEADGNMTYNPSTGKITATGFIGALTGQADTVATITGLAPDTATTQATQSSITTCANLVTVGALNSGSITSGFGTINNGASDILTTGSLGATGSRLTKGWFTDLQVTNAIAADITGNSATVTSFTPASGSLILSGADAVTITTTAATNVTLPTTGTLSAIAGTETLTNKRITPRVQTFTTDATPAIDVDSYDAVTITAQAGVINMSTDLTGTPVNFQKLIIRMKDNATPRAITWGASYEDAGVALPTTTVASKLLTVGLIYNTVTSKWGCVASVSET